MPFLPLQPCCFKGTTLPGEPTGELQPISGSRTVGRYLAKPKNGGIAAPGTAVVLFYDAFGFAIPNPKIMADTFADRIGLPVFVIDYIPNPMPPATLDPVIESYPLEYKNKGMFSTIMDWLKVIPQMVFVIPRVLTGKVLPVCKTAVQELQSEGYTKLGAIGYCRGGSMVINLLSNGSDSPLTCGVIAHPSPEPALYAGITKPTQWHLADHDSFFAEKQRAQLKDVMAPKREQGVEYECTLHTETVHGFAARPNLEHEPTLAAFQSANENAVAFFKKHLLSSKAEGASSAFVQGGI